MDRNRSPVWGRFLLVMKEANIFENVFITKVTILHSPISISDAGKSERYAIRLKTK